MGCLDFISVLHKKTERDYLERVERGDKPDCARVAREFGYDYWDGDRKYGYGGYHYDGRWAVVAERMAKHYRLESGMRVLDVGCGKGFLLHELKRLVPGLWVQGLEVSQYALDHGKEEVHPFLLKGTATALPFDDSVFDLVLSINTLHNLRIHELFDAIGELERVKKKDSYIVVESYRNEVEKANLLHWQLTCESFFSPEEWGWIFNRCGYTGDHTFIFFE